MIILHRNAQPIEAFPLLYLTQIRFVQTCMTIGGRPLRTDSQGDASFSPFLILTAAFAGSEKSNELQNLLHRNAPSISAFPPLYLTRD